MNINEHLVAVVSGGASGLGEATVDYLVKRRAKVAVLDQDMSKLDQLKLRYPSLLCIKCDVTVEEDVKAAVAKTCGEYGALHVAVCCAGVAWPSLTLFKDETPLNTDMFEDMFRINVLGSVLLAKYAAIAMSKNQDPKQKGVILFTSSIAAKEAQRGQVAYGASKGALNGLVLPMARDLGKYGIRVVSIMPGIFQTPMTEMASDKVKQRLVKDTPMGRAGQPYEFAHFVASIIENGYVNGVSLRVDGAIRLSNM